MKIERNESLRASAEELVGTLLLEVDDMVDELAATTTEIGFETRFSLAPHRQRVEWFTLEAMAAAHALDGDPSTRNFEQVAFAEAHLEPLPKSVVSPIAALGFNLEAMRIIAHHARAHYRTDEHGLRRVLRALVAMFESSEKRCMGALRERLDSYKEHLAANEKPELPVFTDFKASGGGDDVTPIEELSERERDVFELVALGHDNASISRELFLSESTVKSHVRSLLVKTKLKNRTQLALLAVTSGVVTGREVNRALIRAREERSEQLA